MYLNLFCSHYCTHGCRLFILFKFISCIEVDLSLQTTSLCYILRVFPACGGNLCRDALMHQKHGSLSCHIYEAFHATWVAHLVTIKTAALIFPSTKHLCPSFMFISALGSWMHGQPWLWLRKFQVYEEPTEAWPAVHELTVTDCLCPACTVKESPIQISTCCLQLPVGNIKIRSYGVNMRTVRIFHRLKMNLHWLMCYNVQEIQGSKGRVKSA